MTHFTTPPPRLIRIWRSGWALALALVTVVFLSGLPSTVLYASNPTSSHVEQHNAATARRVMEAMWTNPSVELFDEAYQPRAIFCPPFNMYWCHASSTAQRQAWAEQFLAAFPDLDMVIQDVRASGDIVIVEQVGHGTLTSAFRDLVTWTYVQPTNRHEDFAVLVVLEFDSDGKIRRDKWYWSWNSLSSTPSP